MEFKDLLEKIKPQQGSGVQDFDKTEFLKLKKNKNNTQEQVSTEISDEVYEKCKVFFAESSYSELLDYLYEDPSRVASNHVKAIKFLAELKMSFKPTLVSLIKRDNFYDYKRDLNFSETLIETANSLGLKDLDFYNYSKELPQLNYSWAKAKLYNFAKPLANDELEQSLVKLEQSFAEIKAKYENDEEVVSHYEERVLYLKALSYKRLDDEENTKKYIEQYLDKSFSLQEKISKLVLIANQEKFSADEVLSNMKIIFGETGTINNFIEETSLLTGDTCGVYSCDDCCRYTYPSMSLTEFEYIKNWALENDYDFSSAITNANEIQDEYHKKTGKYFKIENKTDDLDLNPEDFKFACPFLDKGRCSVHPARPLLCRVFGLGSTSGESMKSCNFYLNQYQYMNSPEHERLVYDARGFQAMLDESDKYLTQSNEAKIGLIPAFLMDFAQTQE